ncbi:uncharacterized protein LOC129000582 [Macrosteles quadrilineatus]|uniref:uncharacterized protein LOC129000582 n=1 Tax=Macrosteles quadrilineatus TaxID=74068 RepID=UPI0023E21623|nr:uncharacterized protein LOC129000582 [Macrosteles quadrilineatus]
MEINPGKCSILTFHRSKNPDIFMYILGENSIPRVTSTKDLGVIFSSDLSFDEHINSIVSKANRLVGFISRSTKGMNNPSALKTLYCAMVRQCLEYASPIWTPYTVGGRTRLEAIQERFLRLVGVCQGYPYREVPTDVLAEELKIRPLHMRRSVADVGLLYKLLRGHICCPELLLEIDIRIPTITRSRDLFGRRFRGTTYDFHSPLARILRLGNRVARDVDFFADSYTHKEDNRSNPGGDGSEGPRPDPQASY